MSTEQFDSLLAQMPEIAKVVNTFESESVQQDAFKALVDAFLQESGKVKGQEPRSKGQEASEKPKTKAKGNKKAKGKRSGAGSPSIVKDLNLHPSNEKSFKDFVAEKEPKTNYERNVVAVYYLAETLKTDVISADHVFTCYSDADWRVPKDLRNNLSKTGIKGWLDTSDQDDIKLTIPGRNLVIHDLPRQSKK